MSSVLPPTDVRLCALHALRCGAQVSSANIVSLLEAASAAPRDRGSGSDNGSGSTVAGWQAGDAASSTSGGASLLTADDFENTRRALCPAWGAQMSGRVLDPHLRQGLQHAHLYAQFVAIPYGHLSSDVLGSFAHAFTSMPGSQVLSVNVQSTAMFATAHLCVWVACRRASCRARDAPIRPLRCTLSCTKPTDALCAGRRQCGRCGCPSP